MIRAGQSIYDPSRAPDTRRDLVLVCRRGRRSRPTERHPRARAAAAEDRRADGIALLEQHLAASPRDVDARLVYGLILSWDGQYDRARTAFQDVLAQTPGYFDARLALMNVEWWSGRTDEARA